VSHAQDGRGWHRVLRRDGIMDESKGAQNLRNLERERELLMCSGTARRNMEIGQEGG
jgi:alkylated DNA nucleotide flippase Atl1